MTTEGSSAITTVRWIGLAAGPVLAVLAYVLLRPGDLTETALTESGRRVAAVTVLMAIWWLTEALPLAATALVPEALAPLAGLSGPGGYMVLAGPPGDAWRGVAELVPGVGLVAVNPGLETADEPGVSVIRGGRLPLRTRSMRGAVLGRPYGGDEAWVREAARVVLPGLRVVGEGDDPPSELIDLMASAAGVWVGMSMLGGLALVKRIRRA